MSEDRERYNASGCKDITAHIAVLHVTKEESDLHKRANKVVMVIKKLIELTDFELIGRIQIKDKRTGKEFR